MPRTIRRIAAAAVAAAALAAVPAVAQAAPSPAIAAYCNSSHGKQAKALSLQAWQVYGAAYHRAKAAGNDAAAATYWKYAVYYAQAYMWFQAVCK